MAAELLSGVQVVYVENYYDGPLEGHAWYDGQYCYFHVVNYDRPDESLRYELFDVGEEQVPKLFARRQLFEDLVGHHNTWNVTGNPYRVEKAIGFNLYFGLEGAPKHPYHKLLELDESQFQKIGEFEI